MWTPQEESISKLINFLQQTQISDNHHQKKIYNKFETYTQDFEFPKNLVYIVSQDKYNSNDRILAGIILKAVMEVKATLFNQDTMEYFKLNITKTFKDVCEKLRKTVSNLISTFIRHFGIESWPDILDLIEYNLDKKEGVEMAVETLNIILEDSQNLMEDKYLERMKKTFDKLIYCLRESNKNDTLSLIFVKTLSIFVECCQEITLERIDEIIPILVMYSNTGSVEVKSKIGNCWFSIIHLDKQYLLRYYKDLFTFFLLNMKESDIDLSFISAEFFLYVITSDEGFINIEEIKSSLQENLNQLTKLLLVNMQLTENDINYLDNKFQNDKDQEIIDEIEEDDEEEHKAKEKKRKLSESSSGSELNRDLNYNPEFTMRKCCCRIIDNLSHLFPDQLYSIINPLLEQGLQSDKYLVKERSILALGAISEGCYGHLTHQLVRLIPYLLKQTEHPNKYVRSMSIWTLSKFTRFIMIENNSENKENVFKDYLRKVIQKFLDLENMVRDSAGTAFQEMIATDPEMIAPFLIDVLNAVMSVFDNLRGTDLLSIYEVLITVMETYPDTFCTEEMIHGIVKRLVQKWYDLVKVMDLLTLPQFFDVINTLISVSGPFLENYTNYFLCGCLKIMEYNVNEMRKSNYSSMYVDKDLLTRALDTISIISKNFPQYLSNELKKVNIIEFLFEMMNVTDLYIIHYIVALFGDLIQLDKTLFNDKADKLFLLLIPLIHLNVARNQNQSERFSVCNNSIWTIGLLSMSFPTVADQYIDEILNRFNVIFSGNKNMSIGIGRLSLINPGKVSKYLEAYIRIFSLSLKNVEDSVEKRDSFKGICMAIRENPQAVFNSMNYFCDAICAYNNPPNDLFELLKKIIYSYVISYGDSFKQIIKGFPENLKKSMTSKFQIIIQ